MHQPRSPRAGLRGCLVPDTAPPVPEREFKPYVYGQARPLHQTTIITEPSPAELREYMTNKKKV